jgi:proteasome assembly chaperone (PAC2) family protein
MATLLACRLHYPLGGARDCRARKREVPVMTEFQKLNNPTLVAVWPGMGHVAISAGYYLMSKLGMTVLAEFSPRGLFEVDHAEVKGGLIRTGRLPRSRFFVWKDPAGQQDIVVFIGEAQPPAGKYAFCNNLIEFAKGLGVNRVFTFAAMATQMRPDEPSRVFAAATDEEGLAEVKQLEIEVLEDGHIGGLNGVLLGVAAEQGLHGYSLLGEMPGMFVQLPFPKASLAVLEAFAKFTQVEIDFAELAEQSQEMEGQLGELLSKVEQAMGAQPQGEGEEDESWAAPEEEEPRISSLDEQRIEQLFNQARGNKSKAYELKKLLDRLDVFKDYEDRFLDLFSRPGGERAA